MFLELLLSVLLGIIVGSISGIIPGLHTNLISVLVVSLSGALLVHISAVSLCCFLVSLSVTHVFLSSIPSVFIGAPEEGTALGVLPGHRYLLHGQGLMAVKLMLFGAFGGLLISILLFPFCIAIINSVYPVLERFIWILLIAIVLFMVLRDRKRIFSAFVFFLSGTIGLLVLNIPNLNEPLFPLFSGLFGVSTLLISINKKENIPEQKRRAIIQLEKKKAIKALFAGQFAGFLTALLPSLGASTAAVIGMQLARKLGDHGFMILLGAVNIVNFIFSLGTLLVIGKARNGSIVAVQNLLENISLSHILVFICASLVAGGIAVIISLKSGEFFSGIITRINYKKLVIIIISFVSLLVTIISGPIGFLVLIASTAAGMIPAILRTSRTNSMGCLLLPVILNYVF